MNAKNNLAVSVWETGAYIFPIESIGKRFELDRPDYSLAE